ncbi:MAG: helix-turn-helix transcriptional regulator [Candidatus Thermoplasmatota archaeon]|jgi:DNA-binding HxlR family transcriptional regulator|nr:helix-turn-helix transcriptional regulator [Candidatus Thermoplasmatota archaeon]MCL5794490.1 helix-turn-helix transcriptional regulator [Candidatus Thermoplasmatota archaeon]
MKPTVPLYVPGPDALSALREELRLLSGAGVIDILYILDSEGESGFNAIRRRLGRNSSPGLSRALRNLQSSGMVSRRVTGASPPRVYYSLTQKGTESLQLLHSLLQWSNRWNEESPYNVEISIDPGNR